MMIKTEQKMLDISLIVKTELKINLGKFLGHSRVIFHLQEMVEHQEEASPYICLVQQLTLDYLFR